MRFCSIFGAVWGNVYFKLWYCSFTKPSGLQYSGTPPYDHPVYKTTSLLRPYSFKPNVKTIESFSYFEDPVNATTSLLRPGFYRPTVVTLTGFHCIQKFSGNFNAVCGFPMSLCAVFIPISVRFCGIHTPLTPPSLVEASTLTVAKFMICEGQKQSPGEPCIFYH